MTNHKLILSFDHNAGLCAVCLASELCVPVWNVAVEATLELARADKTLVQDAYDEAVVVIIVDKTDLVVDPALFVVDILNTESSKPISVYVRNYTFKIVLSDCALVANWAFGIFCWITACFIAWCAVSIVIAIIFEILRAVACSSDRISWIVGEPWFKECLTAESRVFFTTSWALTFYAFSVIFRIAASLVANWTASIVISESVFITAAMVGIFGRVTDAV